MTKTNLIFFLIMGIFVILQSFIELSFANELSAIICFISTVVSITYINKKLKKGYFLSLIPIISVLVATQLGPLFIQTLYLTPVSFNLKLSYLTFLYTALLLMSLIVGHFIYSNSNNMHKLEFMTSNILKNKTNILDDIPGGFIFFGSFIAFLSIYFGATNDIETGEVGGKSLLMFQFLYMLPLVYFYQGIINGNKTQIWYFKVLILYFVVLVILGIIKNSRGLYANVFLCSFLIIFYLIYTKKITITAKKIALIILLSGPFLFVLHYLNKVSDAMLATRGIRNDTKGVELFNETMNYIRTPLNNISQHNIQSENLNFYSYNEFYTENSYIGRLLTIKYDDNVLFYSKSISEDRYFDLNSYFIDKLISLVPQNIINLFYSDFNKDNYLYSYGDWVYYLSTGSAVGGFKLGSITGSGLNLFGFFFYIVVIFTSPLIYIILESLAIRSKSIVIDKRKEKVIYQSQLSAISILCFFSFYNLFNIDSLMNSFSFFLRGFWQNALIFSAMLFFYSIIFLRRMR